MTNQEKWKRLSAILDEAEAYGRAIGKLNFDMECCAPEEGMEQAGDDMALLGKHIHALTHSPEYAALVGELHADGEGLSFAQRKTVEHLWERYEKEKNLTEEFDHAWSVAANRAYGKWLTAKKASDFSGIPWRRWWISPARPLISGTRSPRPTTTPAWTTPRRAAARPRWTPSSAP